MKREQPGGPPISVLIVGGGTAGWMTAAALAQLLPPGTADVRLIESRDIGTVGVGEATVPHIRFFNAKLGFDEADFMARTRATFKLGVEFRNWSRVGDSYIHPFGAFGRHLGGVPFHQHWLRAHRAGLGQPIESYSLPIIAARRGKFSHPVEDRSAALSTFSYAYQFDAGRYAAYLRTFAEARGVMRTEGKIVDVRKNGASGFVESIVLASGECIAADLVVDCSGFRGLLIGGAMGTAYEDWTHWLPCDRAFAVPCAATGPPGPSTRATAREAGWMWRIPLQHRVGNGHVYASRFIDDDEALRVLLASLEAPPEGEPKQLRFTTGKRRKQWTGNVVAIGLAAGFLEPLESTGIHLIQLAIGYLLDLFPNREYDATNAAEFNRIMAIEYERVRDFLILHYHATERDDTPFWNYCRTMPIPESLANRLTLFRERGIVAQYREGMFLDASWLAVLLGQHVMPRHYDPLCDRMPADEAAVRMASIAGEYSAAVDSMPAHRAFLEKIGADYRGVSSSREAAGSA